MKDEKLAKSIIDLKDALDFYYKNPKDKNHFAALSKSYEVCFEYCWKYFKREADLAGFEIYSPRDSIKAAAQMSLIVDVELWAEFLNLRNLSVHDYLGTANKNFLQLLPRYIEEIGKLGL